jgi:hypothetical protein
LGNLSSTSGFSSTKQQTQDEVLTLFSALYAFGWNVEEDTPYPGEYTYCIERWRLANHISLLISRKSCKLSQLEQVASPPLNGRSATKR